MSGKSNSKNSQEKPRITELFILPAHGRYEKKSFDTGLTHLGTHEVDLIDRLVKELDEQLHGIVPFSIIETRKSTPESLPDYGLIIEIHYCSINKKQEFGGFIAVPKKWKDFGERIARTLLWGFSDLDSEKHIRISPCICSHASVPAFHRVAEVISRTIEEYNKEVMNAKPN